MLIRWVCVLALAAMLPAQTVRLVNYTAHPFEGWKRCTVDVKPPYEAGMLPDSEAGARYVRGRQVGEAVWVLDVWVRLPAGGGATLDLAKASPWLFVRGPLPRDPLAFWGVPSVAGGRLQAVSAQPDGAGYLAHLRGRFGRMLCADVWLWWYPDWPAIAFGEVVLTASDPSVEDMVATIPADCRLAFGGAIVVAAGAQAQGACLLPEGETIADGQARAFPVTLIWREHLTSATFRSAVAAVEPGGICATGLSRVWPTGNPLLTSEPLAWTRRYLPAALEALGGWGTCGLGVLPYSGSTGAQEDQVFVGAELGAERGLGAEVVRYLVALGQLRRPCHHLEAGGQPLDLDAHPNLVMWSGRAHIPAVSKDQLGKPRALGSGEAHGWAGPDEEHWLLGTVFVGARATGSPALQWHLQHAARQFLFQKRTESWLRMAVARPGAARAVGWEGLVAAELWWGLEDRELAAAVAERWRERVRLIHLPFLSDKPADIWDVRNDPRLASTGYTWNWMPYQQAIGAYGLDLACEHLGPPAGRELALRAARAVLERAFLPPGDRWTGAGYVGFDPARPEAMTPLVEGAGAHIGGGVEAWMVTAAAVVLRHDEADSRARAIWAQFRQEANQGGRWLPPELMEIL